MGPGQAQIGNTPQSGRPVHQELAVASKQEQASNLKQVRRRTPSNIVLESLHLHRQDLLFAC